MVLNIKNILEIVDGYLYYKPAHTIEIVVPIIQHIINDDKAFLKDIDGFKPTTKNGKIILAGEYNGRKYEIYDDFYGEYDFLQDDGTNGRYKHTFIIDDSKSRYSIYYRILD